MIEPALLFLDIVVFCIGLDRGLRVVANDVRLNEHHQIGLVLAGIAGAE